ncbi:hypothetical protein DFH06DRAFT_641165 [Mycena polygramma]|nr:hypothetical protein DFH06DRAFT_641165 [Mycena polygramma]
MRCSKRGRRSALPQNGASLLFVSLLTSALFSVAPRSGCDAIPGLEIHHLPPPLHRKRVRYPIFGERATSVCRPSTYFTREAWTSFHSALLRGRGEHEL